jgi:dipeptidase
MKGIFLFLFVFSSIYSNTIILVTKKASKNNSILLAYSEEDSYYDRRIIKVPSLENKKRNIYKISKEFPRYVGKDKGKYYDIKGYKKSKPLFSIDSVKKTYSYIDANAAILNEKQVSIAYSKCKSKFYIKKNIKGFCIKEISKIVLERCKNCKEAIDLLKDLLEKYDYSDKGYTLVIADTKNAYNFEISPIKDSNKAAFVIKKIENGKVFVAANLYKIREINKDDKNIIYSKNLLQFFKNNSLDWRKLVSEGEYYHPYNSLRRIWRVYSIINEDIKLNPYLKSFLSKDYPYSIKPKSKISKKDIFNIFRDHFENTQFDLTKKLAAGPFGNPHRYLSKYDKELIGAWERSICFYKCAFTSVVELRDYMPDVIGGVLWLGLGVCDATCFVPIYSQSLVLPISYQTYNPKIYSQDSAAWIFESVFNISKLKYLKMQEYIKQLQNKIENIEFIRQENIEKKAIKLLKKNPILAKNLLSHFSLENADFVIKKWLQLKYYLMEKYLNENLKKDIEYSKKWLEKVGYENGPIKYQ